MEKGFQPWADFAHQRVNAAIEKATLLADHAHDDGDLPNMFFARDPVQEPDGFTHGTYHKLTDDPKHGGMGNVHPSTSSPINTALHEFAHHIWEYGLSPEQQEAFTKAAESSDAHHQIGASDTLTASDKEYLRRPKEHFARAYAQWVAEKTGDAHALSELDNMAQNPKTSRQVWQAKDFQPASHAIESIFKEKGWLK